MNDRGSDSEKSLDDGPTPSSEDHEVPSRTDSSADLEHEPLPLPNGVLGKVLSKTISCRSLPDPGPPPDGGVRAWIQVLAAHILVAITWGGVNTFGVFQAYYTSALHRPPSDISWVGSVQIFLLFFIGTFSGRATDGGLFRITYILGAFFQLLGVFMTAQSSRYWEIFLAQGVSVGIGNGLLFCPTLTLVSTYFSRRRALAIGITASGTATGGIIFPVIVQQLLPQVGFAWTVRVLGFVWLAMHAISLALFRVRLPPRKSGPLVEWSAFREAPYVLFCIGMFFVFWALYFAFYYISAFGRSILHVTQTNSINLLLIMNGVGAIGRIVPAYFADHYFGPLNTLIPFTFISALLLYCWAGVSSPAGLIVFGVFYGMFGAGIQSLFPATLTSLTSDIKKTGVRIGMCFSVISFACLTGPPLAGALIQENGGKYLYAQMFAGSSMLVGGATLVAARWVKSRWRREMV